MSNYLIVESRDPYESRDVSHIQNLAKGLTKAGHRVTVFLVQNGVLPVRKDSPANFIDNLLASGVTVYADRFSLQERAMSEAELKAGVDPQELSLIVDQMVRGTKVFWH